MVMRRFDKRNKMWKGMAAAFMAVAIIAAVIQPFSAYAGVKDESTFDSAVKGTNTTYYRTIATNYHAGNILGLVTLSTADEMIKAANITSDEQSQGYEPVLYVNIFPWDSSERKAVEKVVNEMNGTLVAMVDIQLFRYELLSFQSVNNAGSSVKMIAGIPEKSATIDGTQYTVLKDDGREFAMIRVHNGEVSVLRDQDSDQKTITFQSDKFSAFGLIYAPAGEIDRYLGNTESPASQQTDSVTENAGTASGTAAADNSEWDEVPKTGDIRYEIEYSFGNCP